MKVGWTTNVRGQQRYLYINHFSVNSVFPSENSFNALTPGDNLIPVWSRLECSFSFVERPKSDGSRSKPAAKLQYHWNRFPSEFVQMFYDCLDLKVVLFKSRHVWHSSLHDTKKKKSFLHNSTKAKANDGIIDMENVKKNIKSLIDQILRISIGPKLVKISGVKQTTIACPIWHLNPNVKPNFVQHAIN